MAVLPSFNRKFHQISIEPQNPKLKHFFSKNQFVTLRLFFLCNLIFHQSYRTLKAIFFLNDQARGDTVTEINAKKSFIEPEQNGKPGKATKSILLILHLLASIDAAPLPIVLDSKCYIDVVLGPVYPLPHHRFLIIVGMLDFKPFRSVTELVL